MIGLTRTNHEGTALYINGVSELNFYKRYQSNSNTKKLRNSLKYEYHV